MSGQSAGPTSSYRALEAQVAALTRERDELLKDNEGLSASLNQARAERDGAQLLVDSLRETVEYSAGLRRATEAEIAAARADAARLREVLERVRDAMLSTGQAPDGDDDPRRPLATAVWDALDGTARGERVGMAGLRDE